MVAKVRLGRSFGPSVRYLLEGRHTEEQRRVDKRAELLDSNGIRRGSVGEMAADFNRQRLLNPDLKVAVWHTALSFSPDDVIRLTNELIIDTARKYLTQMNIDPARTQWLLVRHNDREHPHAHLLLNRIDRDGHTIDASFCQSRSRAVAISIAHEKGLTLSVNRPTPAKKMVWEEKLSRTQSSWSDSKRTIFKAVALEATQSTSLNELTSRLADQGIQLHRFPSTAETDDTVRGITFEYQGHFLKGSQLDRHYSWPKLKSKLDRQLAQGLTLKQEPIANDFSLAPRHPDTQSERILSKQSSVQTQERSGHRLR